MEWLPLILELRLYHTALRACALESRDPKASWCKVQVAGLVLLSEGSEGTPGRPCSAACEYPKLELDAELSLWRGFRKNFGC